MFKRFLFIVSFLFCYTISVSQEQLKYSVYSEVSIITIGPGKNLYDAFGHSAIRLKDPLLKIDHVFNYGMFDFNQPNFYSNFAKGRLLYKLGIQQYDRFIASYSYQERWMKEQVLDLSHEEKQKFFEVLLENAKPENAEYLYDPFFNNCATKLIDITSEVLGESVVYDSDYLKEGKSLRILMNKELPWNNWGSLGINIALGTIIDHNATAKEYTYLPDYVYLSFKNATKSGNPLVKKELDLLNFEETKIDAGILNPFNVLLILSMLFLFVTLKDIKQSKRSKWLDFLLLLFTGLIGVFLVFLWFFTDHKITPNNFNVLWAFAPNLFIAFILLRNTIPNWVSVYLKLLLALIACQCLIWVSGIQLFNFALIPFIILLVIRYYFLNKSLLTFEK